MPADEVDEAFAAALAHDAHASPPEIPPPPRMAVSDDPDAPHGRGEDGAPLAPYGTRADGKPRLKPAGPGRGHRGKDEPRETDAAPASKTGAAPDYTADLAGLATTVWVGASTLRGGRVPLIGLPIPDMRGYAWAWHDSTPELVSAWNNAAQHNATVRRWVEKWAGSSDWQWVIGVSIASANFLAGCQQIATDPALRERAAKANDADVREFLAAAMAEAGSSPELEAAA